MVEKKLELYLEQLNQDCSVVEHQIQSFREQEKEYNMLIRSLSHTDNVSNLFQVEKNVNQYQKNLQTKYEGERKQCAEEIHTLSEKKKEYEMQISFLNLLKNYMMAKESIQTASFEKKNIMMKEYLYSINQIDHFLLQDPYRSNVMLKKLSENVEKELRAMDEWNDRKKYIEKLSTYSEFVTYVNELNQMISESGLLFRIDLSNLTEEFYNQKMGKFSLDFLIDLLSVVYYYPDLVNGCVTFFFDDNNMSVDADWDLDSNNFWIADAIIKYYSSNS